MDNDETDETTESRNNVVAFPVHHDFETLSTDIQVLLREVTNQFLAHLLRQIDGVGDGQRHAVCDEAADRLEAIGG